MIKRAQYFLDSSLKHFSCFLQTIDDILQSLNFLKVNPSLLFDKLFLCNFLRSLIQTLELFLNKFPILLILKPLIARQVIIPIEEGVPYLVDNILWGNINGVGEFGLQEVEVAVNCLL